MMLILKNRLARWLLALGTLVACGCHDSTTTNAETAPKSNTPAVRHVDARQAASLLTTNTNIVVLDVRTPAEFAEGRIRGATNINFNAREFEKAIASLDPSRTYLVHCAVGGRSTKSLSTFQKLGFQSVVHLDGGMKAWEKAGNPVDR